MNQQSVELIVWLGIAALAVLCANLGLWHARRVLCQSPGALGMQDNSYVAPALSEKAGPVLAQ